MERGAAGMQIATALSGSPDIKPVAYIDDKKSFAGKFYSWPSSLWF